jgi:multimeric flavodoxin WrbA
MLKILGFNGSPRSGCNTSRIIKKALEGAASQGASTEYFDLGSFKFDACQSCLICKKGPQFEGKCYHKDALSPIIEKIKQCDGFVLGFPIYAGLPSALGLGFLQRAAYSCFSYRTLGSTFGRKIKTGLVAVGGAPPEMVHKLYQPWLDQMTSFMSMIYGNCDFLGVYKTLMLDDDTGYFVPHYDELEQAKIRKEQFPADLAKAYELGKRLATK